jgi:stalled ribosome rescue protein Dom34
MIGDYEIVEYKNQFYPDRTYYRATIENGTTKHHTDYEVIVEWLLDRIVRKKYYEEKEAREAGVIERFMEDVKYKD